jgi:hypothetical protein
MTRAALLPLLTCLSFAPVTSACVQCDCLAPGAYLSFVDGSGQPVAVDSVEFVLDGESVETVTCDDPGCEVANHQWTSDVANDMELEVRVTVGEQTTTELYTLKAAGGGCCGGIYVDDQLTVD